MMLVRLARIWMGSPTDDTEGRRMKAESLPAGSQQPKFPIPAVTLQGWDYEKYADGS